MNRSIRRDWRKEVVIHGLNYAARGWAVFPVHGVFRGRCGCGMSDCSSPGKHPLTRRGVKDATTSRKIITRWWKRWPDANLALATGEPSGVVVIDVDPPRGEFSLTRLLDAGYELPETAAVRTGSGGLHLYYGAPGCSLGNSAGRLPGVGFELPGVDLRADGGYVVAPPSIHVSGWRYAWMQGELAEAPSWLAAAEEATETWSAAARVAAPGSSTPYGLAALSGELEELKSAPVGARNHTLNRCAFRLGRLVAGGELNEAEVIGALRAQALSRGLAAREIERTIASGLAAGRRQPRSRPRS
jgi:Bifunctional DNA primase/polymerase, N-terminal